MTDKELKRLSRRELLEMLIEESRDNEALRAELEKAHRALEDRTLKVRSAGTMAEAAVAVNRVFEAADAAARQYLENLRDRSGSVEEDIRKSLEEARTGADSIRADAAKEADQLLAKARAEADAIRSDAAKDADQLLAKARAEADSIPSEARSNAGRILTEAGTEAERIRADARDEADEVLSKARAQAVQLLSEADNKAEDTLRRAEDARLRKKQEADSYLEAVNAKLLEYFTEHPELRPCLDRVSAPGEDET